MLSNGGYEDVKAGMCLLKCPIPMPVTQAGNLHLYTFLHPFQLEIHRRFGPFLSNRRKVDVPCIPINDLFTGEEFERAEEDSKYYLCQRTQ